MKKTFLILFLAFFSHKGFSQNLESREKAKAEAASRQCINELNYPNGWELVSFANVNSVCCYRNGNPNTMGYTVDVWIKDRCAPNTFCVQVIYPLATVVLDCNGQVTDITCTSNQ